MKGIIDNVMLLTIGLVIMFIVLGMIISITYKYDPCWENAHTQIKAIQSAFNEIPNKDDSKLVYAEFNSCVDGVVLMNKEEFYDTFSHAENFPAIKNSLNCVDQYEAFIVAAPRLKEGAGFFGGVKDFLSDNDATQMREWGIQYLKQETNIEAKPICENVPIKKATFDKSIIKEISTLGGKFCINIRRTENLKFDVLGFDEVTSKSECVKPET